jgi:hypothetical protein
MYLLDMFPQLKNGWMKFRTERSKEHNAWLVVQNSDDMIVVGFDKAKYANRTKNFLNSGGAFDGDCPSFFCREVEIFDGDLNVVKQES